MCAEEALFLGMINILVAKSRHLLDTGLAELAPRNRGDAGVPQHHELLARVTPAYGNRRTTTPPVHIVAPLAI